MSSWIVQLTLRALCSIIVWLAVAYLHLLTGYFDTVKQQADYQLGVADYLYYFFAYGTWAVFSLMMVYLLERLHRSGMRLGLIVALPLGLVLWLPLFFALDYRINHYLFNRSDPDVLQALISTPNAVIFFYAILYGLTFGVCMSVIFYNSAREQRILSLELKANEASQRRQLADQQLQLLRSQLSPHFLFNCLGAISALAREGRRDELVSAITRVGNMLRFSIKSSENELSHLGDEIAFVEDYTALQKLRFNQRFAFKIRLEGVDEFTILPPLILQPLVENAFVHSVAVTEESVNIELVVRQYDGVLEVCVKNDFFGTSDGLGTGLDNLAKRLLMTYGDRASLSHERIESEYVSRILIRNQET